MEAGRGTTPLRPSLSLFLPSICSAQAGVVKSSAFDWTLIGFCGAVVAPQGVVHRPLVPVGRRTTRTSAGVELTGVASRAEVPASLRDPPTSLLEVIQHLTRKAGFSKQVARVPAADLRHSLLPCTSPSGSGSSVGVIDGVLIPARRLSLRSPSSFITFTKNSICLFLR